MPDNQAQIVLSAEDKTRAAFESAKKGFRDLGAHANEAAKGTGNTSYQMTQLGHQVRQFAEQVSSGGSPLTALFQQGTQAVSIFGGVGNTLKAVGSLVSPFAVGMGAGALALGALALAAYQGRQHLDALNKSLQLTGGFSGVTASSIEALSKRVADLSSGTVGQGREAVQALASTGKFGPGSIEGAATAIVNIQRLTGQTADEVVKDFAQMAGGVAKWAVEANKHYHYLTPVVYEHIRSLESQGRSQEAIRVNTTALNEQLAKNTQNLGFLEIAWDKVAKTASLAWDAMLSAGRSANLSDKIAEAQRELDGLRQRGAAPGTEARDRLPGTANNVAAAQERLRDLARQGLRELDAAGNKAAKAQDDADAIAKKQKDYVDASLSLERSGFDRRQALAELARHKELINLQRGYDEFLSSAQAYVAGRIAIERAGLSAKEQAITEEIALEKQRKPETQAEGIAQQAKLVELETKRIALSRERATLEEKIRRGEFAPGARNVTEAPQAAFRQLELAQSQAVQTGINERKLAATHAAHDLVELNKQLAADLIVTDRERALAQIAIEEEQLRRRLDLESLNADERQLVEEQLAKFRGQRTKQETRDYSTPLEGARRGLDKYLDDIAKTGKATEDLVLGAMKGLEDGLTAALSGGKFDVKAFVNQVLAEMVRLQVVRPLLKSIFGGGDAIGNAVSGALGGIGSLFGGLFRADGGPVSGGRPYVVGERGPELFMPDRSGLIVPNGGWGSSAVIHQTNYIDSRADAASVAQIAAQAATAAVRQYDAQRRAEGR